jgi:hypothetical protein
VREKTGGLRLPIDLIVKLEFNDAKISSDGGLLLFGEKPLFTSKKR